MSNLLIIDIHLRIEFGEPIALSEFARRIPSLLTQGVYALREGTCLPPDFEPLAQEIKYIGKAIGETVFSRCQKHLWTVTDAKDANGRPKTRPGTRFKAYRASRQFQAEGLYVFPALMPNVEPYLVSCAEELLLFRYAKRQGDIPAANTKR